VRRDCPGGTVRIRDADLRENGGQTRDRAPCLPQPLDLGCDPGPPGFRHVDAKFVHAVRRRPQRSERLDGGVVGKVLGDVGELDVPALGCPSERGVDVHTRVQQGDQSLVRQQDAVGHVGTEAVLHDRLPHRRRERRIAGLVPHRGQRYPRDPCGADEKPVRPLLLQRGVLEVNEQERVLRRHGFEERPHHGLLVVAVHDPGGAIEPDRVVDAVFGVSPVRRDTGRRDLLAEEPTVEPAERHSFEREPR